MKINALLKKSIAEFLGVLMFLSSIVAAVANSGSDHFAAHAALAATLGLAILLTAGVSGGHLNPAVSLYFYAKKAISLSELGAYVVAQLAGALAGAFIGAQIVGKSLTGFTTSSAAPSAAAIIGELFATGGLVFLVGYLAANKLGNLIPAAVGFWVMAAAGFTITGAQANPAVSFGLSIAGQAFDFSAWIILAQLAGVAIAMVFLSIFAAKPAKAAKKAAAKKK
jgi:glycerol uptake facilitator-like aquaporin